ncbi:hypothetical protein C9374_010854 [Naegleria lovaniensis]|uniref:F-box domain-containing protein n=1 Tax=Naegleria lovaniensis TaxID=51637 RepID=A0AA88KF67_NAELO|nr:uncharacterized protein C9374_010854 [Naegleria lovaniensis]KAG2374284.1 hypothetical protein C9374_010854 [Naegleria lovaniensis]
MMCPQSQSDTEHETMVSELSLDSVFIIMEFLPVSDIYHMLLVCKSWNRLEKFEIFWKQILSHYVKSHQKNYELLLNNSPTKHHSDVYKVLIAQCKKFHEMHIVKEKAVNREKFKQYMEKDEESEMGRSITFGCRFKKLFTSAVVAEFSTTISRSWSNIIMNNYPSQLVQCLNGKVDTGTVCDILFKTIEKVVANKNGILYDILRNKHLDAITTYIFHHLDSLQVVDIDLERFFTRYNPILTDEHLLLYFSNMFYVRPSSYEIFKDYISQSGNFENTTRLKPNEQYYRKGFLNSLIRECFQRFNFDAARLTKNLFIQLCNNANAWKDYIDALESRISAIDTLSYSGYTDLELCSKAIVDYIDVMEIEHFDVQKLGRNARPILAIPHFVDICDTIFIPRGLLNHDDLLFIFHYYGCLYPHIAKYCMGKANIDIYSVAHDETNNKNINMIRNYICTYASYSAEKVLGYLFTEFGYQNIDLTKLAQQISPNNPELEIAVMRQSMQTTIQRQFSYDEVVESVKLLMTRVVSMDFDVSFIHQVSVNTRNSYFNYYYTHVMEMSKALEYLLDHVLVGAFPFLNTYSHSCHAMKCKALLMFQLLFHIMLSQVMSIWLVYIYMRPSSLQS